MSKRLTAERRSGFLDNISARVEEAGQVKKAQKERRHRDDAHSVKGGGASKTTKRRSSFPPQVTSGSL